MANNLKVERIRLDMKQSELAEALNVSTASIQNWEKDIGGCSASNLLAMSNIFGCTLDYLLGVDDERGRKK